MVAQGTVIQMVQNVLSRIPKPAVPESENPVEIKPTSENVEIKKTEAKQKIQPEK
jgi:hypothetical protein